MTDASRRRTVRICLWVAAAAVGCAGGWAVAELLSAFLLALPDLLMPNQ